MKAKIVSISPKDAYYWDRDDLIGQTGEWYSGKNVVDGFECGFFVPDDHSLSEDVGGEMYFIAVKVEELP